jgi:PAS domain S-box-containing protein
MSVAASNRGTLTIIHVAWLSDAIRQLKQNDFQAVMVDLDLPDAKGLKALHALMGVAPHLPILVLGDDTVLQQLKIVEHGAHGYLLKHRLDADTLMRALHGSIASKAKEGVLISDQKRAQMSVSSVGNGVLSTDNAGLITFLNPVAERLIGWTYDEAAGRHLLEVFQVIKATTRERVVPRVESKVQKGGTMILLPSCILVRRDGHESPIEEYAALIYDRSKHIVGMVVIFHEVTESHAVALKLAQRAEYDVIDQGIARAPTESNPVALGERKSSLSLGQQGGPRRFRSAAPRALS